METGRVIQRRYLLQRLIQQGQTCVVYQGFDQVLQRTVAVKIAAPEYVQAYRTAIRATAQFTHPNIVGIYDLIVEPDALYIVQEYVDGDDFGTLLQSQLAPYYVVDFGVQVCRALMYADTPSRKICHGDLTPSALLRDRRGMVRVNNFAFPCDAQYFAAWSVLGNDVMPVSDPHLPAGQSSEARSDDDTRAVGLLLYQLLAGRSADARMVEPPVDGRLRFMRNAPPEVCEVIARAILRQHPQHIATPEALHAELKVLADALEPPPAPLPTPAVPAYQTTEDMAPVSQAPFILRPTGNLMREGVRVGSDPNYGVRGNEANALLMEQEQGLQTAVDMGMSPRMSPQMSRSQISYNGDAYASEAGPKRINMPLMILLGLVLFVLFFGIGYYLSTIILK